MQPKALKFAEEAADRMTEVSYRLKEIHVTAEQASIFLGLALCIERGEIGPDEVPDLVDLLKAQEALEKNGVEADDDNDDDTEDQEGAA